MPRFPSVGIGPSVDLTVVVPMFNEAKNVEKLFARLVPVMEGIGLTFEILCVDDGSRDDTVARLEAAAARDSRIRALAFSRNFGKEIALAAGLNHARGRAVVIIDADLQHPPEVIARFVERWRAGVPMVYGVRKDRATDGVLRRNLSRAFYRLFDAVSPTRLPPGAGDFRLMDRKVVDALNSITEQNRFTKGLYAWVGFKSEAVEFDVDERADGGHSRFSARRLISFAIDGITAFSTWPLRVWTYVGLAISALAFLYAGLFLFRTIVFGADVPGFPSLIVSVMFFAGVQLITLGVLGEYVGRIFMEVKDRPLYVVEREIGGAAVPVADQTMRADVTPR